MVLLGVPGAGKGSFARKLSPHFNIPSISTGDLIRDEIKGGTEVGKQIAELTSKGKLVDDVTV